MPLPDLSNWGTKVKFWYRDDHHRRVQFKVGRENWAEKACCEIARLLGLPHAEYELAAWGDQLGVASPSIVPESGRLILGNELLAKVFEAEHYDPGAKYRSQHTLRRVVAVLRSPVEKVEVPLGWFCPPEVGNAEGVFAGYLLMDALVGNQDRHHENWALISIEDHRTLAHTFDHASSLGRNESDAARKERLMTKDAGRSVAHYAARARSGLYKTHASKHPLSTVDAFADALRMAPKAGQFWLQWLADIDPAQFKDVLNQIPNDWITPPAIDFAYEMLDINRKRLLKMKDTL